MESTSKEFQFKNESRKKARVDIEVINAKADSSVQRTPNVSLATWPHLFLVFKQKAHGWDWVPLSMG